MLRKGSKSILEEDSIGPGKKWPKRDPERNVQLKGAQVYLVRKGGECVIVRHGAKAKVKECSSDGCTNIVIKGCVWN